MIPFSSRNLTSVNHFKNKIINHINNPISKMAKIRILLIETIHMEVIIIIRILLLILVIVSAIICILSLHEIAPIITNELINIFSYDKDIKIIEEYLYNNKNSINQITQTPYLVRLVQKAKESEHYPRIR